MPAACKICAHDQRDVIDRSILAGTSLRAVARTFQAGRSAIARHGANHVHAADVRAEVAKSRKMALSKVAVAANLADVKLDSPADVLAELRWAYAETKALYEIAKNTSDTRLMDKAIGQSAGILDRFAKSFGMFTDGAVYNIDASTKRLEVAVGKLSDEQLAVALAAIMSGKPGQNAVLSDIAETIEGEVA